MRHNFWKMNIATILISLAGLVMNLTPYEGKDWGMTGLIIAMLLISLLMGIWGTVTGLKASSEKKDC